MTRAGAILFAAFIRGLAAIGGAVTAYGVTGMFTTAGVEPPNAIVFAGLAICVAIGAVVQLRDGSPAGLWPALLVLAVPYTLYAWGAWTVPECPAIHPPIGSAYSCAPIGSHAIGVVAPILSIVGAAAFVIDVRRLARGRGAIARSTS